MLEKKVCLSLYDIFPKIVPAGREVEFTLRILDPDLLRGAELRVDMYAINGDPECVTLKDVPLTPLLPPQRGFTFRLTLPEEQEYQIRLVNESLGKKPTAILPVYALDDDLIRRRPLVGDLHSHSLYSDGQDGPAFMGARYRQAGFDFLAVTDHRRYAPSVMCEQAYDGLELPIRFYHGEEVHTPGNFVHIVNFGSDNSANDAALNDRTLEGWRDKTAAPGWMERVKALASTLDGIPDGISPDIVASAMLVSEIVRAGGGMCIFPHPHWLRNVRNVPDKLTRYFIENGIFDAFELIGGQSWQENQTQVALYNQLRYEGISIPVVGSSDSHGTMMKYSGTVPWPYHMFTEERTVVFALENTRDDIICAVKDMYSTAVQKYEGQYPQVYGGSYRIQQYTLFLLENYFPLRDELYFEEGRLMHEFIAGTPGARERLLRTVAENEYFEKKYILR